MSKAKYELKKLLGDKLFQEPLIREALMHRSVNSKKNNERLEFLGDAILGSIVAEILYFEKPRLSEGGLTRMRSYLVRRTTLASLAREINLAEYMIVSKGEAKSGGLKKTSLLANAFEAIVAALHILRGRVYTKKFILKVFEDRFADLPAVEVIKDAKSRLQEMLQAKGCKLPVYTSNHKVQAPSIRATCQLKDLSIKTTAVARSKQIAEQEAASLAIKKLQTLLKTDAAK